MKHISIGALDVSRIGLGCMSMTSYYNVDAIDDNESIRTIHRALDLGVTHIDTAEIYGPYTNEELVGKAIKDRRNQVVLATKFGLVSHAGAGAGVVDSSPANIRIAVEGSLKRLGTDRIDLYYQHRVDPKTPIEDTVGVLAELLPLLRTLGIGFVPYSPLGHGFLTGTLRSPEQLRTTTGVRPTRASPRATSRRTCASSTRSRPSRPRSTPRRRRSRWPGCSRRATTSPRSPAPSGSPASKRTPLPTASS